MSENENPFIIMYGQDLAPSLMAAFSQEQEMPADNQIFLAKLLLNELPLDHAEYTKLAIHDVNFIRLAANAPKCRHVFVFLAIAQQKYKTMHQGLDETQDVVIRNFLMLRIIKLSTALIKADKKRVSRDRQKASIRNWISRNEYSYK
jgi:hypothetical protein